MSYYHIEDFLAFLTQQERSPSTVRGYLADVREFQKSLDKVPTKAERKDVDLYMASLRARNLAPKTIGRKIAAVTTFYKALRYYRITDISPTQDIVKPKIRKKLTTPLTKAEVDALRDFPAETFDEKVDRLVIELFYSTGARRADLATAKISDYNSADATIRVIGKGSKEAYLMLTDRARTALDAYLASVAHIARECLLVYERGTCLGRNGVYDAVKRIAAKALPGKRIYPHLLRHSIITHRYEAGQDIRAIKDFARHSSINTTDGYISTSLKRMKQEHAKFNPDSSKTNEI